MTKSSNKVDLSKVLVQQMDDYTNKAFAAETPEMRDKYREIVRAMQELFVLLCKLEK